MASVHSCSHCILVDFAQRSCRIFPGLLPRKCLPLAPQLCRSGCCPGPGLLPAHTQPAPAAQATGQRPGRVSGHSGPRQPALFPVCNHNRQVSALPNPQGWEIKGVLTSASCPLCFQMLHIQRGQAWYCAPHGSGAHRSECSGHSLEQVTVRKMRQP